MKNYETNRRLEINILLDNLYILLFQHIFFESINLMCSGPLMFFLLFLLFIKYRIL